MTTGWDWQWFAGRWCFCLTIDLCSFMIGLAWGPRGDFVFHFTIATICIEPWEGGE